MKTNENRGSGDKRGREEIKSGDVQRDNKETSRSSVKVTRSTAASSLSLNMMLLIY